MILFDVNVSPDILLDRQPHLGPGAALFAEVEAGAAGTDRGP
jgi:hypothetical protein